MKNLKRLHTIYCHVDPSMYPQKTRNLTTYNIAGEQPFITATTPTITKMSNSEIESIVTLCKYKGIEFIRFEACDICGVARSKIVPLEQFESFARRGINFFLGIHAFDPQAGLAMGTGSLETVGFTDGVSYPQPKTFKILPWAENTARVLIEPTYQGVPFKMAPRYVARQQIERLKVAGYKLYSGHEYEFYMVKDIAKKKPLWKGINYGSTIRNQACRQLVYDIIRNAKCVDIQALMYHVEYAPGQLEIPYAPDWGIKSADNAFTFKHLVKEICQDHGIVASFMTKPWMDQSANGCHFNHSLWTLDKKNAMFDSKTQNELSDVGKHWLAGLLKHTPAISALLAPTVNCGKRFRIFSFAPINASWGIKNRTCAMRVKINGEKGTYIENRIGCGSSNPYLVLAVTIAAGLDGINKKMSLPNFTKNGYDLEECAKLTKIPIALEDRIEALKNDRIICEALGDEFITCWMSIANHLIDCAKNQLGNTYNHPDFNNSVSDHERDLYFEFL